VIHKTHGRDSRSWRRETVVVVWETDAMGAAITESAPSQLVGRDTELERSRALIDQLPGEGGALLVHGPPGIGKSALLDDARAHARHSGYLTLGTSGVESEAELAFAGLHQLLRPVRDLLAALPEQQKRAIEAALGITGTHAPDPYLVSLAANELVATAAASTPILLIVDDAQWVDRSSLSVIAFIARRLASEPVAMIAAIREGYTTTLEEARLPTMRLEQLNPEAASTLLDRSRPDLHPISRSGVLSAASGNPLALIELGKAAPAHPPSGEALFFSSLPLTERLQEAFTARVQELDDQARQALLVAALDQQGTVGEIITATTVLRGETVEPSALDPAATADLIELDGDHLAFRHPVIRTAVSKSASASTQRDVYRALASTVVDPERRLWHEVRATVGQDDRLADLLAEQAETARRRGAVIAAAAALERSAELTTDPSKGGERLIRAAEVTYDLGLIDAVRSLLARAAAVEVGDLEAARAEWLRQMIAGDFWSLSNVVGKFVGIADQMAQEGDCAMAIRSLVPIAHRCWWVSSKPRTREYVVGAARRAGVSDNDPRLLAVLALADPEKTAPEIRRRLARRPTVEIADPVADTYRAIAAEKAGDFAGAAARFTTAVDGLREQGALRMLTQALTHVTWVSTYTGGWQTAREASHEAVVLAEETRQPQYGAVAAMVGAISLGITAGEDQMEQLLARPAAAVTALGGGPLLAPAHIARAAAALSEGRNDEAYAQLRSVFNPDAPVFQRFMRWATILDFVEAAVGSGREQIAATVLAELEEVADTAGPPILKVGVICARPLLADDEHAPDMFASAISADMTGYPFLRARTLFASGRWLRRHRRHAEARLPLRAAADYFTALGATRWSQRVRAELRASGERDTTASDERDGLTAQEREIAELAAQGLSNKEIGERLFLSPRTVGAHLYRIFPKLGITTRAQLRDTLSDYA
jgi:DNA-binding CsgD family transcriptional regulator